MQTLNFTPSQAKFSGIGFDAQSTLLNLIYEFNQPVGINKIENRYETQSGAWANPSYPTPINGNMVIVYNSTANASRLYIYTNAGWHYTALT